jgi:hypothetical protein
MRGRRSSINKEVGRTKVYRNISVKQITIFIYNIKYMKNIVFLIFLFCFTACKTPAFVEKKVVEFDTGFPLLNSFTFGTWHDKKNKKEYIYFGNHPVVRFFTIDGQRQSEIEDIPLKNGVKGLTKISSIFVYDIDTVVILSSSAYNCQMVYLNRKGERIQKINFSDSLFGTNERYRMLYCANQSVHKPFVYFHCFWNWLDPVDSNLLPSSFKNEIEHLKVYYKKHYETPSVCKWDVRTNTCTFTAANMIPTYFFPRGDTSFNENTLVLSEHLHNCYAHKLFIWMRTSNRILVLNPDNLQVEHSFDINSKYSTIGIPPVPLELRNQKFSKSEYIEGRIVRILYDKNHNLYYIFTRHKIPEEDMALSTEAPLSIHIYNTKIEKLKEQSLEGGKYDYRFIFLTSQGLFIAQNENNKDYDPTKLRFYFFEIEK